MLSGTVLKQFRTYLKSQVGHGWYVEARKTVANTLGNMVNCKQLRRPRKGVYALNPKDIQRLKTVPDHSLGITLGKSVNSSYINKSKLVSSQDIEIPL